MNPTKENKTMHTPTPWKAFHGYVNAESRIVDGEGKEGLAQVFGNYDQSKANAEFIVRAVNAHEDLVKACHCGFQALAHLIPLLEIDQQEKARGAAHEIREAICKAEALSKAGVKP